MEDYLDEPPAVQSINGKTGHVTLSASDVGALPSSTTIPSKISDLTDDSGHYTKPSGGIPKIDLSADVRTSLTKADTAIQDLTEVETAISGLATRLNILADSDDSTLDQLSEIVAYIKNNKSLIDGITTGKVSVSDIVDNLTSTATNKPLSAKQGKALKDLIDAIVIPTNVSAFTNDTGYLTQHQDISGKANTADLVWVKGTGKDSAKTLGATEASGNRSVAEGTGTTASGSYSHTEGAGTTASNDATHAEGDGTTASGKQSHAEGLSTKALADNAHSEGYKTEASGQASHAEG